MLHTRLSQLQSALSPKCLPEGLLEENVPAYTTAALGTGTGCTASAPEGGAGSVALAHTVVQTNASSDDPLGDRSTLVSAPVPDLLASGFCQASMQVHLPSSCLGVDCWAGCLARLPPYIHTCSCCQVVIC